MTSECKSFGDLPRELQEAIFRKADTATFRTRMLVCKDWADTCRKLSRKLTVTEEADVEQFNVKCLEAHPGIQTLVIHAETWGTCIWDVVSRRPYLKLHILRAHPFFEEPHSWAQVDFSELKVLCLSGAGGNLTPFVDLVLASAPNLEEFVLMGVYGDLDLTEVGAKGVLSKSLKRLCFIEEVLGSPSGAPERLLMSASMRSLVSLTLSGSHKNSEPMFVDWGSIFCSLSHLEVLRYFSFEVEVALFDAVCEWGTCLWQLTVQAEQFDQDMDVSTMGNVIAACPELQVLDVEQFAMLKKGGLMASMSAALDEFQGVSGMRFLSLDIRAIVLERVPRLEAMFPKLHTLCIIGGRKGGMFELNLDISDMPELLPKVVQSLHVLQDSGVVLERILVGVPYVRFASLEFFREEYDELLFSMNNDPRVEYCDLRFLRYDMSLFDLDS